jgi:hypothetical protein
MAHFIRKHLQNHEKLKIKFKKHSIEIDRITFPEGLENKFNDRILKLRNAIDTKNADDILILFKSKCLYSSLKEKLSDKKVTLMEPLERYNYISNFDEFHDIAGSVTWISSFQATVERYLSS